jgi:signal transduction histidine kinase
MTGILEPARGGEGRYPGREPGGLRALLDVVEEGLLGLEDGRIVWANRAAAHGVGVEGPEELVGRVAAALLESEPGGRLPGPPPDAVACRLRLANGGARPVALRSLGDGAGGTIWVFRETGGEERLAELEGELKASRERAWALAEQLGRQASDRDELLGVLSHELRTPVAVIAGFGRLLLAERVGPLNAKQRHFLEESARSCRRLDAFIANLVACVRAGSGQAPLARREASLLATVEGAVTFVAPLLDERQLHVQVDVPSEADRAFFDPAAIEEVLTNLLGNALKYSPPGGTIGVRTRHTGSEVRVEVADAGPGIPEEDRERIFEPWVRAAAGEGAVGLGLGLAICRRIVEAHGGRIGVEPVSSDVGPSGSRFFFSLPDRGGAGGREQ